MMNRSKKIAIIILIILIFSPMIVNSIMVRNSPFGIQVSNNNDWISFFGSYIGGLMTLVGVVVTILYTTFQYRDQDRKRIQPYISIKQLFKSDYKNEVANFTNDDYQLGLISVLNETDSVDKCIQFKELEFHGELINIGLGTAINVGIKDICIENRKFTSSTNEYHAIQVNGKIIFRLMFLQIAIFEDSFTKEYKEYCEKIIEDEKDASNANIKFHKIPSFTLKFNLSYCDMLDNMYIQKAKVRIQVINERDGTFRPNVLFQNITYPSLITSSISKKS